MKIFAYSIAALALSASAAIAQAPPMISDTDFVKKAAVGNTFEVEEAKVALERATDNRIKSFAQRMISDHGEAMKKLEEAAGKAGDKKPEMMLDKPHQAMLDNLKTFNGADFDKVYTADQIAAHVETQNLLLDYGTDGKNKALKTWADDTLPAVKSHLADINAM